MKEKEKRHEYYLKNIFEEYSMKKIMMEIP
jgi:hypothetical protein